ncbi:hypothetical protein ACWA2C_28225 [Priestia megaterium]
MATEKGYIAKCINTGGTVNLQINKKYYVYPNGKDTVYVSKEFHPKKAHFGCYYTSYFELLDEIPEMGEAAAEEIPSVEEIEEIVSAPENHEQMSLF